MLSNKREITAVAAGTAPAAVDSITACPTDSRPVRDCRAAPPCGPQVTGLDTAELDTAKINSEVPHSARIADYWVGGKDHYPADREAGEKVAELLPGIRGAAFHNRAFLGRAVRFLAGEVGIGQFLDIGVGLPAVDNTHEIAQRVAPESRVVYVDNDPFVLSYARALLRSDPEAGACAHVDADVCDVDTIVSEAGRTLDFSRPVGLLLLGILNHIADDGEAHTAVTRLVAALAPGSHVVIAHPTAALHGDRVHAAMRLVMEMGGAPVVARTPQRIGGFFDGLDLLEPGVVTCSRWRPDHSPFGPAPEVLQFGGVGRVPARPGAR